MSMTKRLLPPEDEADEQRNTPEPSTSMSLEDAIQEFIRIDGRYRELAIEKRRALEVLLPAAVDVRGQSNTARLSSSDQKSQLKVEFGVNYKCEVDRLNTVKDLVGDDVFESLFKTEYSPRLRALKPFLSTKSTDERIETAKTVIREAVTTTEKSPQITVEKGRSDPPPF